MDTEIEGLLEKLRAIENELEQKIEAQRIEFQYQLERKRVVFEKSVIAQHREIKLGLLRFLRGSPILALLTAPAVYALIVPLALLDLCVTLYQIVCFPIWGIARVRRSDYIVIDRHYLAYLNIVQKINCVFCGYANGLIAYIREIASRSEQYWCPIKHALRVKTPHHRYRRFLEFGDATSFRDNLDQFRDQVRKSRRRSSSRRHGR